MSQHDVIIIGGGISGMSLAHYCAKAGMKPLVVDKNGQMGGTFNTCRTDNFWFELGAHTCYNSYGTLVDLLRDTGSLDKITKPDSVGYKLITKDGIKSIMSQMSFPELVFSLPRMFGAKMAGETVESYYSKIFGKRNFAQVIGPMFNAVICQKSNEFPADMLFKKRPRRKDVLKKFSLQGGLQSITDAIATDPAIETLTGKEVQAIEFAGDVFTVTTTDGGTFQAKYLALATPSEPAAKLLQHSFPEVAQKLAPLQSEKVETLGVVVKKEEVKIGPIAALAATDEIFYSFVSRDTFPDPLYRAFAFHFKASAGGRETRLQRIAEVIGTGNFEHIASAEHVIPSLRLGHKEKIEELDALLAGTPLLLTGNYFSGIAIEDCVARSLQESKRLK
ncbi:MAG: FAD-dependent oxidoreductase [Deltaproteobacteria bacterium]|nr:FAD-dependent oxidoreductase [Deltaproteobacteria bacterium]TLN01996.1 MAG: FAD-dependent oxidoreductase [bacterium]